MQRHGRHGTCFKLLLLKSLLLWLLLCDVRAGVIWKRETPSDPDIVVASRNVSKSTKLLPQLAGMQDNFKSKQALDKIEHIPGSEQLINNDIELTTSKGVALQRNDITSTTESSELEEITLPALKSIAIKQPNINASLLQQNGSSVLRLKPMHKATADTRFDVMKELKTLQQTVAKELRFLNSSQSEKRAKFINDNSTNAQQLNLPDAAEVWTLAGLKNMQPKMLANGSSAVNEKNLHDWTQIMLNNEMVLHEDNATKSSTMSSKLLSENTLSEEDSGGVEMLHKVGMESSTLLAIETTTSMPAAAVADISLDNVLSHTSTVKLSADNNTRNADLATSTTTTTPTPTATLTNSTNHADSANAVTNLHSEQQSNVTESRQQNIAESAAAAAAAADTVSVAATTQNALQPGVTVTTRPEILLSYNASLGSAIAPTTSEHNDDESAAAAVAAAILLNVNKGNNNSRVSVGDSDSHKNSALLNFDESSTVSTLEVSKVHGTTSGEFVERAQISISNRTEKEEPEVVIVAAETKGILVESEATTANTILANATTTTTTERITTTTTAGPSTATLDLNSKESNANETRFNTKFNSDTSDQSEQSEQSENAIKTTITTLTTTTVAPKLTDNELFTNNAATTTATTTTTESTPIIIEQTSSTSGSVAEVTSTTALPTSMITTAISIPTPVNVVTKLVNDTENTITTTTSTTIATPTTTDTAKEDEKFLAKVINADTENSFETNVIDRLDKNIETTIANTPNFIKAITTLKPEIATTTATSTTTTTITTTTAKSVDIVHKTNSKVVTVEPQPESIDERTTTTEQNSLQLNETIVAKNDMETSTAEYPIASSSETPLISLLDDSTSTRSAITGNASTTTATTTPSTNSITNKIEEVYKLITTTVRVPTEAANTTTTAAPTAITTATARTVTTTAAVESIASTTESLETTTTKAIITIPTATTTTTMLPPPVVISEANVAATPTISLSPAQTPQAPPPPPSPPAIFSNDNLHHPNSAQSGETDVNVIIAITVSVIGVVALLLLVAFLYLMRKRQKQMSYSQRCRPVSLDAYSLDNVSVLGSVRRKGALRASKKSYGNAAFDDPSLKHNVLNAVELSKFIERRSSIFEEYRDVPQIIARPDEVPQGCEDKNRYANVIPLPETRVILQQQNDDEKTEYINANYVRGPKDTPNYYIACQAPLETTIADFWRMIWEQQSRVIIQATDLTENGIEKCGEYLPPSVTLDNHTTFGDFQVTLKHREIKDKYAISTLLLKHTLENESRELMHYWYRWPETGVPSEEAPIIAMLLEARSSLKSYAIEQANELKEKSSTLTLKSVDSDNANFNAQTAANGNGVTASNTEINGNIASSDKMKAAARNQGPLTVHCSPGTGRTGTIIACDMAIRSLETPKRSIDIPQIVYYVRRGRASAVQTKEQYEFIYKVAHMYATKITSLSNDN